MVMATTKPRHSPLRAAIERAYDDKPVGDIIETLYRKHGNWPGVAQELGVTRQTLYNWIGLERMQRIRAEQMLSNGDNKSKS